MAMTVGEMTPISHVRRAIRSTEGQLGAIDRMLTALSFDPWTEVIDVA